MNKNNQKKTLVPDRCRIPYGDFRHWSGIFDPDRKIHGQLHGSFGFVILISIVLAAIVQLNVWRVLCVSGMRGQDVANKVLPGLGYVVAFLVVAGGLVFNIGNVGGGALVLTPYSAFRQQLDISLQVPLQSLFSYLRMH